MNVIVFVFVIGIVFKFCQASGVIDIKFVYYTNPNGTLSSKTRACCDTLGSSDCARDKCDPYFHMCLQDTSHTFSGCFLGEITTGWTRNSNQVHFGSTIGTNTTNPMVFHFTKYGGSVIPKITVFDEDITTGSSSDVKIDYMQYVRSGAPDINGNRLHVQNLTAKGQVSSLKFELNVRCDKNFYGTDCLKECIPDSVKRCDDRGDRICRNGGPCDFLVPQTTHPMPTSTQSTSSPTTSKTTTSPTTTKMPTSRKQSTTDHKISSGTSMPLKSSTALTGTISSASSSVKLLRSTTTDNQKVTPSVNKVTSVLNNTSYSIVSTIGSSAIVTTTIPLTSTTMVPCKLNIYIGTKGLFHAIVDGDLNTTDINARLQDSFAKQLVIPASEVAINITVLEHSGSHWGIAIAFANLSQRALVDANVISGVQNSFCQIKRKHSPSRGENNDSSDSTGTIAGVTGGVLATGVLSSLLFFLYRRKCRPSQVGDNASDKNTSGPDNSSKTATSDGTDTTLNHTETPAGTDIASVP